MLRRDAETLAEQWDPARLAKKLYVPTYDEILEKIKSRYPKRYGYKTLYDAEIARLQTIYNIIISKTNFIRTLVNILDNLHPFFWDLIRIEFNEDDIHKAISCIAKSRRLAGKFWEKYRYRLLAADSPRELRRLAAEARGRMLSPLKRCRAQLEVLRSLVVFLSRMPAINPFLYTIIVAGAPSTGKSTFVSSASRAKPRISPYPFTTRNIHVGHLDVRGVRVQLIDTPGILDRPLEEMNAIERKAAAALRNISGAVLLLVDVSDAATLPVERQFELVSTIVSLGRKSIYVMLNKVDVADKESLEKAREISDRLLTERIINGVWEGSATNAGDTIRIIEYICARERWFQD